ncbi:glucose-1-phosphate cytidylyltransferase [archaeon]|jgi:glucose-1-phosphate cytidylyltransferase|nr:glucose-1-phosphate cytidylyltransferase [archaeon]MBT4416960.1 glucose-1-phosphate cytidylyltransferase [archaeon]
MEKPKVVILCGGMGTRMNKETEFMPKPLVNVGSHPILWHIMKTYSHYGFNDFVLCLGYKGDMIKNYFRNFHSHVKDYTFNLRTRDKIFHGDTEIPDWNITFANTGLHSNTGCRIKKIEKHITGDNFMVTYGDGVADINIPELLNYHRTHGKVGTVTTVRPSTRFGNLTINEHGQILDFTKKTKIHEGWIDGGFFVFNKKIFDYLTEDPDCMLEREPLKQLASEQQFMSYKHKGFWQCMDTTRDHQHLNNIWKSNQVPWRVWR